jgi:hypothetical protein
VVAIGATEEVEQLMGLCPFIVRRGCGAFWGAILHVSVSEIPASMIR